jgi:hypothetical protein
MTFTRKVIIHPRCCRTSGGNIKIMESKLAMSDMFIT